MDGTHTDTIDPMEIDQDELRERLTPEQYRVTQQAGTEPAWTGPYLDEKRAGTFKCVVCGEPLFSSETKYDSGSGWPSFTAPMEDDSLTAHEDRSFGMVRTESTCANCGAHLGHVFGDGPGPAGLRFCINGAALDFDPDE